VHPVPVTLAVGEPVETQGLTMKQVDEVTKLLEEQVAALYYEHSGEKSLQRPSATPGKNENETGHLEAVTILGTCTRPRRRGDHEAPRIAMSGTNFANKEYCERSWPAICARGGVCGGMPVKCRCGIRRPRWRSWSRHARRAAAGSPADVNPQKYGEDAQARLRGGGCGARSRRRVAVAGRVEFCTKPLLGIAMASRR